MVGILVTSFLFAWPIFRGYVSFGEGTIRENYTLHIITASEKIVIGSWNSWLFLSLRIAETLVGVFLFQAKGIMGLFQKSGAMLDMEFLAGFGPVLQVIFVGKKPLKVEVFL